MHRMQIYASGHVVILEHAKYSPVREDLIGYAHCEVFLTNLKTYYWKNI